MGHEYGPDGEIQLDEFLARVPPIFRIAGPRYGGCHRATLTHANGAEVQVLSECRKPPGMTLEQCGDGVILEVFGANTGVDGAVALLDLAEAVGFDIICECCGMFCDRLFHDAQAARSLERPGCVSRWIGVPKALT